MLAKGFSPAGVGHLHLHNQGVGEEPSAWDDDVFWPLLLGTRAPASLGCHLTVLAPGHCSPGGIRDKPLVSAGVAVGLG